jgi:hypothetical protein
VRNHETNLLGPNTTGLARLQEQDRENHRLLNIWNLHGRFDRWRTMATGRRREVDVAAFVKATTDFRHSAYGG